MAGKGILNQPTLGPAWQRESRHYKFNQDQQPHRPRTGSNVNSLAPCQTQIRRKEQVLTSTLIALSSQRYCGATSAVFSHIQNNTNAIHEEVNCCFSARRRQLNISEESRLHSLTEAWWRSDHKILRRKDQRLMASTAEHKRLVQSHHFTLLPGIKCGARPVAKSILTLLASSRRYPAKRLSFTLSLAFLRTHDWLLKTTTGPQ